MKGIQNILNMRNIQNQDMRKLILNTKMILRKRKMNTRKPTRQVIRFQRKNWQEGVLISERVFIKIRIQKRRMRSSNLRKKIKNKIKMMIKMGKNKIFPIFLLYLNMILKKYSQIKYKENE